MTDDPIPAATLVLVRDDGDAPRLLMVERAAGMAFAGGAMVFPGGRIDRADVALGRQYGGSDLPARIAALRETVEETAIPAGLSPLPSPNLAADLQGRLASGARFADLLDETGLSLDLDGLVPLARWVPQFHASRRFDTLFFLARAPEGQWSPRVIPGECTDAFWLTAEEVLDRDRAGTAKLIFPTRRTLQRLAQFADFDAMAADARRYPVDPITPWIETIEGERFITIAEDIGFPVVRERIEGLWRG